MEHVYELYGSTEAPISTVVKPGDPPDSVGEVRSKKVLVVNSKGEPCPPGRVDERGHLLNYEEAVGEIVRKMAEDNLFFDGYHNNKEASAQKYKNGYFRSGDLGHIRRIGRKRYLYFDGRTDDWIRKDGENFSAENVAQYAAHQPDVALAVAYGVPSEVADEKVMVALQMAPGATFHPQMAFDYYKAQTDKGGMDPKWIPDFIRTVTAFEMTPTQKVVVRSLKRQHFRPDSAAPVFFRERGDETYRPLGECEYADLERRFRENGRAPLLER
jgi:fatty-acyl-CoA synthase